MLSSSTMTAMASLFETLGRAVKQTAKNRSSGWWYTPHMVAASSAIAERIPLVDLLVEVRDARIPFSSMYEQLGNVPTSTKHIIALNKIDLASRSHTKEWMKFFDEQKCMCFGVNSHNKDNVRELLTFLQARVRELKRKDTITIMLVGIPNVGKSALANSLHKVGRISAAEKGKLKHAIVSSQPGETKDISSLKVASHPNIYILDTPGILAPDLTDDSVCSKLALTGAIDDSVVGEISLAQYCVSILCSGEEYKKWGKLLECESGGAADKSSTLRDNRQKRQYPTDHTQDFIVNNVRSTLFRRISSCSGSIETHQDLAKLTGEVLDDLLKAFQLPLVSEDANYCRAASKLLNLYRTGRLGHYTLDTVPSHSQAGMIH